MAYERINWQNGEVGNTPLNANNLNRMDMTLEEHDQKIGDHDYEIENLKTGAQGITEELNKKMDRINPQGSGTFSIPAVNADNINAQTVEADEIKVAKVGSKGGTAPVVFDNDILVNGITTPIGSLASSASAEAESASERAEDAYNLASRANREAASAINKANENRVIIDKHTGLIGEGVGDKWPILGYLDGYYIAPNGSVTQYNATATVIKIDFLDFLFRGDNIIFNHVDLLPTENCIPCAWYDISGNFISAADGLNIIAEFDEQTSKITKQYIDSCIIPVPAGASSCKLSGLANGRADIRIQTSLSEAIKELQSKPETAPLVLTNPSPLPCTDGKKILGIDSLGKSWQDGTPTPENAIPITDASNEVTAHTKNLFDKSIQPIKSYIEGNNNRLSENASANTFVVPIKANTTYTVSSVVKDGSRLRIASAPTEMTSGALVNIARGSTSSDLTITTQSSDAYMYVNIKDGTDIASIVDGLQIELGTTATSYVPYQSNSADLPFEPKSVGSAANELIVYEDGTGKIIQRVGTMTTADFKYYVSNGGTNSNRCVLNTDNVFLDKTQIAMCDGFVFVSGGNTAIGNDDRVGIFAFRDDQKGFTFRIDKSISTADDVKNYFREKAFTIYYPLPTPIEKTLTAEEVAAVRQLMTYKGTTIIESEMDVKSVTYSGDVKAYVDDKFVYSYTIRKIGKWADNKDLYQIVVNTTTPSAGTDGLISNLVTSNNCSIKRISGIVKSGNAYSPISDYYNTATYSSIWVDGGGIKMHSSTSDYYANRPCEITVDFTYINTPSIATLSLDETEE